MMKENTSEGTVDGQSDFSRRRFLKTAAAGALATRFLGQMTPKSQGAQLPGQKNLLIILTDQERAPMWFPDGWEEANLPNTTRLRLNGLSFQRAYTAAAMCSPARNTLFTGLFPAQHRSVDTLTEGALQSDAEHQLDPSLPNLATCLKEAGYDVIYKGKWHMSKMVSGADGRHIDDDISRYGFDGWDAPDAGGDATTENFGGGAANHDERFVRDAISFLDSRVRSQSDRPFCLVVSLVNPHDVLGYPGNYIEGGYTDDPWLNPTVPPIDLPPTTNENLGLNKKPSAHRQLLTVMQAGLGPVVTPQQKTNYINFYGNLMKHVDSQIGRLLDVFDGNGDSGSQMLRDTVIIRTSDHGEMGMCHGGLRQKTFNAYEETIRIPLIWSNPDLFPESRTSGALVSHVDFLPTICALTGVPNWQAKGFEGVDYSSLILDASAPPVQDYILFTFDDIYAGSDAATVPNGAVPPPNRLQSIRTADFKYTRYYDGEGIEPDQQEFYDLRANGGDYDSTHNLPLEMNNLSEWAGSNFPNPPTLTPEQMEARNQLQQKLEDAVSQRLQPRTPGSATPPENLKVHVLEWTDESNSPRSSVEISFISRYGEHYQIQMSGDLVRWTDVGLPITGNNGPVLKSFDLTDPHAFYRIQYGPAADQ